MRLDHSHQCACEEPTASHTCFESRYVGCDRTNGRFADVTVERCTTCARLWLRYCVEYEGFSRSGRWARGLITQEDAAGITEATAAQYIDALDWHIRGGSHFDGASRSSGRMRWDL